MNKIKVWLLVLSIYFVNWGVPLYIIYDNHAVTVEEHKGGAFFYSLMGIFFILAFRFIGKKIWSMKFSGPKIIFSLVYAEFALFAALMFVSFINTNFNALYDTLLIIMGCRLGGAFLSFWALKLDKEYLREIEVI